jgi:hypothetical protein
MGDKAIITNRPSIPFDRNRGTGSVIAGQAESGDSNWDSAVVRAQGQDTASQRPQNAQYTEGPNTEDPVVDPLPYAYFKYNDVVPGYNCIPKAIFKLGNDASHTRDVPYTKGQVTTLILTDEGSLKGDQNALTDLALDGEVRKNLEQGIAKLRKDLDEAHAAVDDFEKKHPDCPVS